MPANDRWDNAVPTGIAITAVFEHAVGWSLTVSTARQGSSSPIVNRMRYSGLTTSELIDVVDVELSAL